jgi:hypothetical protein
MKTAEETKENAGFVRDLIALIGIDFPADKFEADLRDAMFAKAFALVPTMDIVHVRRLNEALCEMEFPTPAALGLRRATLTALAKAHHLKEYRNVNMPRIAPPAVKKGGGK